MIQYGGIVDGSKCRKLISNNSLGMNIFAKYFICNNSSIRMASKASSTDKRAHVVIIGSGWGAYRALREINQLKYRITVISPKDYFVFTPFLTGASVGSIEDRASIESIRKEQAGGMLLMRLL